MGEPIRPQRVIWITTDHQRFDCVGANGNPAIHTPHLDSLVRGGISFDNCFIQAPVSMPSRASFMTGLYPNQTGVTTNGTELPTSGIPTCADIFAGNGFATAQIGKLHFQTHLERDLRRAPAHPYGFQYFMLSEEPGCYEDAYGIWLRTEHPEFEREMRIGRPFGNPSRGNGPVHAPAEVSHAGFCVEQAIKYLSQHKNGGPTFMHVGLYAPHPPLNPPEEILARYANKSMPRPEFRDDDGVDKPERLRNALAVWKQRSSTKEYSWPEYRRLFYAMCTMLDSQIGRLLDFLKQRCEFDDTLILFMSDHGDMLGDHHMYSKDQFYHQVTRVPAIMHWPRGLPGGKRIGGLVEAVDLLPTLCGLAGVNAPAPFSGINFANALRNGPASKLRDDVLTMHGRSHEALEASVRTEEFSYFRFGRGSEVLFDLRKDPGEFINCAAKPEYHEQLGEMRERMLERMLGAGASILPAHCRF